MTPADDGAASAGRRSDHGERFAVTIEVDGRPLDLKLFLHDLIGGAAIGLVSGLRGVDDPERVRIDVRRVAP